LFGRRQAPKPLDTNQVACGIKFVGTTWLTRGRAYWVRRVALWLAVLLVTAMAVAMAVGVAIGGLRETHDALLRGVIIGVFSVGNTAAFVVVLALSWPTDARCRKSWTSAGLGRPRGRGATFAMVLLAPLAVLAVALDALVVAALAVVAGGMLALLVLVSLPRLQEEKARALFLQDAHDKYSKGQPSKPHRRAKRHR
jgi:hypothetical protein